MAQLTPFSIQMMRCGSGWCRIPYTEQLHFRFKCIHPLTYLGGRKSNEFHKIMMILIYADIFIGW